MRKFAVMSVALLCVVGVAQANLFQNGDFETGDWSKWSVKPTANGRTGVQDVVMYDIDAAGPLKESQTGRLAVAQVTFQSGVYEGVVASQALNLVGGQEYDFYFDVGASAVSSNAQGGRFELMVGNNVLATVAAGSIQGGTQWYSAIKAKYTPAASGQYEVGLRITRPYTLPSGLYQYIDNATAIPEPASLLLLGLGALLRRR